MTRPPPIAHAHALPLSGSRPGDALLGTLLLVIAEVMFFAGLFSAYIVLRTQYANWPPLDQPRLPVGVTAADTLVLLASGAAVLALPRLDRRQRARRLALAAGLGAIFLAVQGAEWVALVRHGLSAHRNVFGGLFVTIVAVHAAHVAASLAALGWGWQRARAGLLTDEAASALRLWWSFVVGVWPIIYGLLYLW